MCVYNWVLGGFCSQINKRTRSWWRSSISSTRSLQGKKYLNISSSNPFTKKSQIEIMSNQINLPCNQACMRNVGTYHQKAHQGYLARGRHVKTKGLHVQAQHLLLGLSYSKSVCNLCLVAENLALMICALWHSRAMYRNIANKYITDKL